MKCLCCGAIQPAEALPSCSVCGFYLGEGIEQAYKNQLLRLAEYFTEGELDQEHFVKALGNMSIVLDEMHRAAISWDEYIPAGSIPDDVRNVVMKPVGVMREGIDAFEEALKYYNLYAVDPDKEHFVKANEAARKAHNILVNSSELAAFAFREVKAQMPPGTAPSDEELRQMLAASLNNLAENS